MLTSDPCGVYILRMSRGPASAALLNKPGQTDANLVIFCNDNMRERGIAIRSGSLGLRLATQSAPFSFFLGLRSARGSTTRDNLLLTPSLPFLPSGCRNEGPEKPVDERGN